MLSKQHIATIRDASEKLAGSKRRAFQAQVTIDYLKANPRWPKEPLAGIETQCNWDYMKCGQE